MRPVFADSFYYLSLINADDASHDLAIAWSRELFRPVVTTAWVITEVADGLAAPRWRAAFLTFFGELQLDPELTILPPTKDLFDQGLELYARRRDKDWSLTDCISFVVMKQYGITEALTGDHHFEQAGFTALLTETPPRERRP